MHAKAIEIAWHDDSSIWSVDLSKANRLVTAGGDKVARVWRLSSTPHEIIHNHISSAPPKVAKAASARADAALVDWLCDLRAHTTTVNIARFARDGNTIATGADQGEIVLWTLEEGQPMQMGIADLDTPAPQERWQRHATLRAHVQDVLDLAWSADGSRLISASVDNAIMVWDIRAPSKTPITLRNHANFVQGVSIDPLSRLIASLGNDRSLRIFTASNANTWYQVASVSTVLSDSRLFVEDAKFKNCFRRLSWSPDGSLVACPSGIHFPEHDRKFAVHLFARNHWLRPAAQCGGLPKPASAVRFSPILYQLRHSKPDKSDPQPSQDQVMPNTAQKSDCGPFVGFSYRMIFAVACVDSVVFYDTERCTKPFVVVEGLHCAEHTDITWSSDGLTVAISSVDGYISLVCFTSEEIGIPLSHENTPQWLNRQEELDISLPLRSPQNAKRVQVTTVVPQHLSNSSNPVKTQPASNNSNPVMTQHVPTTAKLVTPQNVPTPSKPVTPQQVPTCSKPGTQQHVPTSSKPGTPQHVPTSSKPGTPQHVPTSSKPGMPQHVPTSSKSGTPQHISSISKPVVPQLVPTSSKPIMPQHVPISSKPDTVQHVPISSKLSTAQHIPTISKPVTPKQVPTSSKPMQIQPLSHSLVPAHSSAAKADDTPRAVLQPNKQVSIDLSKR